MSEQQRGGNLAKSAAKGAAKAGSKALLSKKGCGCLAAVLVVLIVGLVVVSIISLIVAPFSFGGKEKDLREPYMTVGQQYGVYWPDLLIFDAVRTDNTFDDINRHTISWTADLFTYEEEWCYADLDEDGNEQFDDDGNRIETCEDLTYYYTLEEAMRIRGGFTEEQIEYALFLQEETPYVLASTEIDFSKYEGQYLWPTPTLSKITSLYGERIHPITKKKSFHYGLDIAGHGALGAEIVAIEDGTIYQMRNDTNGCGSWIQILHENEMMSRYCHLDSFASDIKVSGFVEAGQTIGYVGNTGDSTGPHLHIEIKIEGVTVDPLPLIYNNSR